MSCVESLAIFQSCISDFFWLSRYFYFWKGSDIITKTVQSTPTEQSWQICVESAQLYNWMGVHPCATSPLSFRADSWMILSLKIHTKWRRNTTIILKCEGTTYNAAERTVAGMPRKPRKSSCSRVKLVFLCKNDRPACTTASQSMR